MKIQLYLKYLYFYFKKINFHLWHFRLLVLGLELKMQSKQIIGLDHNYQNYSLIKCSNLKIHKYYLIKKIIIYNFNLILNIAHKFKLLVVILYHGKFT